MRQPQKPYRIRKLHDFGDRCWGVVDANGALVDVDGLSMKLQREEAEILAARLNDPEDVAPLET
ncbi:hypothetical protein [Methylopila turkensis]|uniref:Uncharacterized protein n=1 Tax=Methylopila turkensis TaxID=1437816 RepID=A0A9W6JNU7_9HYPH|nr:hypothetical protein [Methylopila turkensis]GLK79589.1 hypothetical protein GCM10008174_13300 [Methylopila turkensis]